MANDDHVAVLHQGLTSWNAWRGSNPTLAPDLSGATVELAASDGEWNLTRCLMAGCTIQASTRVKLKCDGTDLSGAAFSEQMVVDCLHVDSHTKLAGARFAVVTVQKADFCADELIDVDFTRAKLSHISFHGITLKRVKFERATLTDADFTDCTLVDCAFSSASVSNGEFVDASFASEQKEEGRRGSLAQAQFKHCSFLGANFDGVDLKDAQFSDTDLRRASGLVFDDNLMRGTVLSPDAQDKWSILRRKYTGANMTFNLLFMAAFFLPWIAEIALWSGVNKTQLTMAATAAEFGDVIARLPNERWSEPAMQLLRRLVNPDLASCLTGAAIPPGCYAVWQVLLGVPQGWASATVATLLLTYNLARLLLTLLVAPLRDEERRSLHTPARAGQPGLLGWMTAYGWMIWPHYIVKALFFFAISLAIVHLVVRIFAPVWLAV